MIRPSAVSGRNDGLHRWNLAGLALLAALIGAGGGGRGIRAISAQVKVDYTRIVAPIDGRVGP